MPKLRPLSPADDRSAFDCGRTSLNDWFRRHALTNHLSGGSRVNVLENEDGSIIGYVTLSAAQIERAYLPKAMQRNRPDPVPVTLLGQLAINYRFQGKGYAADLLTFALRIAVMASRSIGSIGVITHPIDDSLREFYARWGFQDLTFDPRRAMIVRMHDLERYFGN